MVEPTIEISVGQHTISEEDPPIQIGNTATSTPLDTTFTVKNIGTGVLELDDVISLPAGYSLATGLGDLTLGEGQQTTFVVRLNSAVSGEYSGEVSLSTNDIEQLTFSFPIRGEVGRPEITLLQNGTVVSGEFNFGQVPVGTSVDRTFVVKNDGSSTLTLTGPIDFPLGFSLLSGFGSSSLNAGQQTTFVVRYTSPGVGYYGGNVTFGSNDSDESQIAFPVVAVSGLSKFSLTLAGTALEGGEAEVDFGYLPLGNAVSQSFVIHNSGSAALTIGTITLPTGFVLTQSPAASVAPGQTTSLTIGTASSAAIEYSGSVTIMTNDPVAGPFTFDVGSHAVDLTQFSLYSDSGVSQTDGISEDPRVSGIVSGGPSEGTKIEIDDTGDGVPDREFTPDEDGRFAFVPVGYQSGEFTVAARLCVPNEATGTNLTSSWDSLSAEYDPEAGNATPEIASVDLLNDTGTSNSDNQTWDPTIQGQVSNDGVIRDLAVEFDVNDDDVRDYTAYTNDTGVFTYRPFLTPAPRRFRSAHLS